MADLFTHGSRTKKQPAPQSLCISVSTNTGHRCEKMRHCIEGTTTLAPAWASGRSALIVRHMHSGASLHVHSSAFGLLPDVYTCRNSAIFVLFCRVPYFDPRIW